MSSMDRQEQRARKVEEALALETQFERFHRAAQLKEKLDELTSIDVVGDLVKVSCCCSSCSLLLQISSICELQEMLQQSMQLLSASVVSFALGAAI